MRNDPRTALVRLRRAAVTTALVVLALLFGAAAQAAGPASPAPSTTAAPSSPGLREAVEDTEECAGRDAERNHARRAGRVSVCAPASDNRPTPPCTCCADGTSCVRKGTGVTPVRGRTGHASRPGALLTLHCVFRC